MKHVDLTLAFRKANDNNGKVSLIGKLIKLFTRSKYYHVEIILNNYWISSDITTKGTTIIRNLRPLNMTQWDYVKLKSVDITDEHYDIVVKWIKDQGNKKYDVTGIILSQVFPFNMHNRNKWFCSELVVKILQLFLVDKVLSLDPQSISPGDLYKIFK